MSVPEDVVNVGEAFAAQVERRGDAPAILNPDLDVGPLPAPVADLRRAIGESACLLFCTPEYAGALPGSFKNLLDWTIGGGEMSGKPVGWVNCSDRGAAGAYAELRTVLSYADTVIVEAACARITVSRSELAADSSIPNPQIRAQLADVVRALTTAAAAASSAENLTADM